MRSIGTLPEDSAQKFADYLATLKIDARLLPEPGGVGVWVCDEDHVGRAREELQQFLREPAAPRYTRATAAARTLRRREEIEDEEYRQLQEEAKEQLEEKTDEPPPPGPRPLTFALMALCVLVAVVTGMGSKDNSWTRRLQISTAEPGDGMGLHEVLSGEVWRLVTPIFLHFKMKDDPTELMHLVFNLLMFLPLAGQVESWRGTTRLLLLVLVAALASNLAQYYLGGSTVQGIRPVILPGKAYFGGLSGVIYALFGYVWMKSRLEPELGLSLSSGTVVILLVWLFLGPVVDKDIANGAHFGGLIVGGLIGLIPGAWRRESEEEESEEE